jgi:hypothetical protein
VAREGQYLDKKKVDKEHYEQLIRSKARPDSAFSKEYEETLTDLLEKTKARILEREYLQQKERQEKKKKKKEKKQK